MESKKLINNLENGIVCDRYKLIAEYMVANPTMRRKEVAAIFELSSDWMSRIYRLPAFLEYMDKLRHEKFKGMTDKAIKVIENLLDLNDFKAALFVLENTGYKMANKIDISAANDIVLSVIDDNIVATPVVSTLYIGEVEDEHIDN